MSVVDISFSPVYSGATTSGTSGCKNWDFARGLEMERMRFVEREKENIILETARGTGPRLEALAGLMTCSPPNQHEFNAMLRRHFNEISAYAQMSEDPSAILWHLKQWIRQDPVLNISCGLS